MSQQPTNQQVLDEIKGFIRTEIGGLNTKFDGLETRFTGLETKFNDLAANQDLILAAVNDFSTSVDTRLDRVEGRLVKVESTMVTKDYLDEKISSLRGDLISVTRKGNDKLGAVVDTLASTRVITPHDHSRIMRMEPFPRT